MVQQNTGCFATAAPHDQNQSTRAGSVLTPDPILMSRTRTRVSKLRCINSWPPQTNHAAAHPGLENPSWNLEFWSWILSSGVPTNATCRSTQWEHAGLHNENMHFGLQSLLTLQLRRSSWCRRRWVERSSRWCHWRRCYRVQTQWHSQEWCCSGHLLNELLQPLCQAGSAAESLPLLQTKLYWKYSACSRWIQFDFR